MRRSGTSRQIRQALRGAGDTNTKELPRGQVLAVARLVACVATRVWSPPADTDEYYFGDYSPIDSGNGKPRYSFKLVDLRRLREPFDRNGALGIWRLPKPVTEVDLA